MPVFGLPISLERVLNPTVSSETLKSWNMYRERDGGISIKIRFTSSDMAADNSQDIGVHKTVTSPVVYKRKSAKTIARDKNRMKSWRSKSSEVNNDCSGVTTRSMSKSNSKPSANLPRDTDVTSNNVSHDDDTCSIESFRSEAETIGAESLVNDFTPIPERCRSESATSVEHNLKLVPPDIYRTDAAVFDESLYDLPNDTSPSSRKLSITTESLFDDDFKDSLAQSFAHSLENWINKNKSDSSGEESETDDNT